MFYCHQHSNSRQYLPRKGTETFCNLMITFIVLDKLFPTIFTPQGDGNNNVIVIILLKHRANSRQYLPRKGTETLHCPLQWPYESHWIPDNIYPARGRKRPALFLAMIIISAHSRQYLPRKGTETLLPLKVWVQHLQDSRQYLPRKGTETRVYEIEEEMTPKTIFPTIFTPQGDGNEEEKKDQREKEPFYSRQYLPRKGTETSWFSSKSLVLFVFPTIFTPQGDGNSSYNKRWLSLV